MADRQAMNSVFDELPILGDVVSLSVGPLAVMTCIERITLVVVWQRCGIVVTGCPKQIKQVFFQLRVGSHGDQ